MADEDKKGGALAAFMGGAGVPASREAVAQALLDAAGQGSSGSGGGDVDYLSYSGKMRRYSIGRDKEQPDPDALYVVDPYASVAGWTCWKGGAVAEKHEWSVFDTVSVVSSSQLRDHGPYADGDGWQFMLGISMFDTDEPGRMIKFTTTSKSGRNVVADLTSEIAQRILKDEPEVPVMRLEDEVFVAQGNKNGKPKFVIEGWVTRSEVERFMELGDDGDVDDLLSGSYAAEEEPEAEADEAPEPRKRRARRDAA